MQDLDPALLRPGRFDRQVNVAPPDLHGREEILAVHTRSKPLGADVDIPVIARRTAGLTGADLANIANEAAIFAARNDQQYIRQQDFEGAMERVLTGLQKRRVVTEKEKRILAYHEGGHALVAYLMGDVMPVQKVTIVGRGDALGLAYYLPVEDRYLHTKEELLDVMKVALAGRAAEEIVFGRVTNGAASDLEKVTQIARAMVFEFGMSDVAPSRTMRADNYALSEETKRMRDSEQARLTDHAYEEALRLLGKHRVTLDRLANGLLEKETIDRDEFLEMMGDLPRESRSAETVGTVRMLGSTPTNHETRRASRRSCTEAAMKTYRSRSTDACARAILKPGPTVPRDPSTGARRFDRRLREPSVPRRPDLLDPLHGRRERCRRQGVACLPSGPRRLDEPGAPERGEVLRDRLAGDGKAGRELRRRRRPAAASVSSDEAATRVGQSGEDRVYRIAHAEPAARELDRGRPRRRRTPAPRRGCRRPSRRPEGRRRRRRRTAARSAPPPRPIRRPPRASRRCPTETRRGRRVSGRARRRSRTTPPAATRP